MCVVGEVMCVWWVQILSAQCWKKRNSSIAVLCVKGSRQKECGEAGTGIWKGSQNYILYVYFILIPLIIVAF